MKVLQKMEDSDGQVAGRLTTKSVRDWRVKLYVREGDSRMRWMRRSRYVAREFALTRGDDTFSSATRAPTSNKFPVVFLTMMHDEKEYLQQLLVLSSLVIGDAFLQVPQEQPLKVTLHGQNYVVLKKLDWSETGSEVMVLALRTVFGRKTQLRILRGTGLLGKSWQCNYIFTCG